MYKTVFLKENEKDIFQALKNQGIKTEVFEHRLAELFNRVYNNYVGYYIFKQDDTVYKMIVLPKTIEPSDSAEKEFVDYLLHYYRIKNIYKLDKERNIPASLLQLAFENNKCQENSHRVLEEFQSYKYMAILQEIEHFFKRHKNSKRVRVDYLSQSVKYKLNLKQNIKELDKTKIHQTQSKDVVFSMLATVTHNALKLFISQKYSTNYGAELLREIKRVQSRLLKKYKIERGYKLSFSGLQSIKTTKLFSKTQETIQLLVDIKSLFGFEQMYRDSDISIEYRQDLMTTSFFINPSDFYEWYVYDILKKYADTNDKTIAFAKKKNETATKYFINQHSKSSNPDYILTDEKNEIKIVIDAKWKNVNKFKDIEHSDYLKLKFDTFLLGKTGYGVISYLLYPKINIEDRKFNMTFDDSSIFEFNTLEVDMEVEKHGNSLDFEFDIKKLEENIEKESQIEEHKSMAERLSIELEIERNSIVSKLINTENNEEREKLKEELDNKLQVLGLELSETLEEQELLPEIAKILEEYEDVLEDESKKFLQSSSAIYSYYKDKQYEHFDYSMPGSGFWKLIELELNSSFVKYIRVKKGVINKNNSCKSILDKDDERNINWVKLNAWDNNGDLKSLMFGELKYLSRNRHIKTLFSDIIIYDFEEQWRVLDTVSKLRNEHAHIKAMPLEKFEELWSVLFGECEGEMNVVKKLLEFKKRVNENR